MVKLLVIDDDQDTCGYLKNFFEKRGCRVLRAYSGIEGLATVKKEKPGIVLLDIRMEGMDGLEVLKEIKNFDRSIKVIMITVASDDETRQKTEKLGADDFIKKPLNTAYLEGTVSEKIAAFAKESKKKSMKVPKILIVDDEEHTRQTLSDHLSPRIECEIIEAADGYAAIEKIKNNDIDLILLDIKMPGISGTEVIEKSMEISKDTSIIVITKWDGSEVSDRVKKLGADYIPKPFSLKVVRGKVEEKLKAIGKFYPKE